MQEVLEKSNLFMIVVFSKFDLLFHILLLCL